MITHCGVFATTSNDIKDTINSLKLLQHRGQEGCGISFINNDNKITTIKNNGLVNIIQLNLNNLLVMLDIQHQVVKMILNLFNHLKSVIKMKK